ncbi:MAG: hypothetical protein AB7V16_11170 [Vulcanibacillus sp.]
MRRRDKFKRVMALALTFLTVLSIPTPINLNTKAYAEDIPEEALSYYGIPGYFGYWYEDWNDGYFYQEWGTASKKQLPDMSTGDKQLYDIVFTTINVPIDKEINRVVVYKTPADDTGITVGTPETMDYYTSLDSSGVVGRNFTPKSDGTTDVDLVVDMLVLSTSNAEVKGSVYKTYIHFVVEYVDKAYLEDPFQWKIDHGLIQTDVTASLEIDAPNDIVWNYKEFENNRSKSIDVELDASGTQSDLDITDYDYTLSVNGDVSSYNGTSSQYSKDYNIYPEDVSDNEIQVNASVTATNSADVSDMAVESKTITYNVINEEPNAYFDKSSNNYVSLPVTLTNGSSDPEDDLEYVSWTIKNSNGDLILYSNTDLVTGEVEQDYTPEYFDSVNFNSDGGNMVFTESDNYTVEIYVRDSGGGYGKKSDTYTRTVYVNTEPQPPVADFSVYEFGYPNESIPIKDMSTDPNNDIVQWTWTKPTINKDDGTVASVSGSLSGNSGGNLTFTKEGTYDITLKVKDYTGFEDTIIKEIKIIPPIAVARVTAEGTLKENRHVKLHSRDSLSPRTDPVQTERNIWVITPLDGQSSDSIKIDTDTSNNEEKNVVFKEPGRYEVYLKVHNNFGDANPTHPNSGASEIRQIIEITSDENPISLFNVGGANPNFYDNPISTLVEIQQSAYSIDDDIIDKYEYVVYRDMDEDGNFADESVYGTYNVGDTSINVNFQQGVSGKFRVNLQVTEKFGQPTIDKFITPSDFRIALSSKEFTVNWLPDITFDIPEWAYTDDITTLTTQLKDEEIGSLNVNWSIKRASESDINNLIADDINTRAEYSLSNNGGTIKIKDSGYYELIATVTDEVGQSYSFSDNIRIYPLPTAVIKDSMTYGDTPFTTKENRKYQLNGNSSYANDYYGTELHAIDHSKDYWEITPLDGQNSNVIKVANGTGELTNDIVSSTTYLQLNDALQDDLLFKVKGRYKIKYQVTNIYGKKSPVTEQIITVAEDTKPIISFDTVQTTYRDVDDSKRAELVVYNLQSSSNDGDTLTNALHRVRYRFDSDNDGSYTDEAWKGPLTIDFTNKRATVKVSHVGNYQFEFYVQDTFGQTTINQFVTTADRRSNIITKVIKVDNMPPNVDFSVTPSNKVDVVFTVGQADSNKTLELDTKINNYVKMYLEANNADFIDTRIETIETSTISTDEQDADAIFNNWINYPNDSGNWRVYSIEGNTAIGSTVNSTDTNYGWTGFWSGDNSEKDYTFEFAMQQTPSTDNDSIGWTFRQQNSKNYYNTDNAYYVYVMDGGGGYFNGSSGSGLYKKGTSDSYPIKIASDNFNWSPNTPVNIKIDVKGNNIKVWRNGVLKIDYEDNNNPILSGGYGPFTHSQAHAYFYNLKITTGNIKTLDEVLKEPTWRSDASKFVINISDIRLPELETTSDKYPVILSRMLGDGLYFAELGTDTNKTQINNFIADNDGRGTFIYNTNMDTALQNLAVWILNTVRSAAKPTTQYILLNEEINYKTYYEDYEQDIQMDVHNWKYVHDYDYFQNDLGKVAYDGLWLTEAKTSFDKVGRFITEYKTKDNPVGTDNRFDEYRKTSNMMNGPLEIFVHRRPIAQFTMAMQKIISTTTAYSNQTAIDFSGEGGDYAQWQPSYSAPSGSTITKIAFKTPYASDDYWYNVGELCIQGYKNGTWSEIKNYDSYAYTSDPISDTINVTGAGYTQVRAYFRMRDSSDSAKGNPGDSYFNIEYATLDTTGFNLAITDTSYDLDHTNRTDKGLITHEWSWKLVGEDTWHSGKLTSGVNTKDYLVKLRVRDIDGESSLGAWSDETVVLLTSQAMPPISQFVLSHSVMAQGTTLGITDTSYDPNGDTIDQWQWKLYREGILLGTYTVANPQTAINSKIIATGIGNYSLTLQVKDSSGIWGDEKATSDVYTQTFKVVPVNHAPTADFNLVSNQSPAWTFPRTVTISANKTARFVTRPTSNFFHEELTRFNTTITDPNGADNLGFVYEWTLENYKVNNIGSIGSTAPASVKSYTTATPFTNSFKAQGLDWGAYKITLKVTDKPKIPPYEINSELSTYVTKTYYQIPDISINGSYISPNTEILVGDVLSLSATTNKEVTAVTATLNGKIVSLTKDSAAGESVYWKGTLEVPSSITVSGNYTLQFQAKTNYGSNTGAITKEVYHDLSLNIIALRLMNFRITSIVNHTDEIFPYTKDMLVSNLINYKAGYYVTFQIDSKGNPDSVNADIYEGSTKKQDIAFTKISSGGGTETWQGKFFTSARLAEGTEISIKVDCTKGATDYDYNVKENWDGRSLITNGSALMDGRVNLTN